MNKKSVKTNLDKLILSTRASALEPQEMFADEKTQYHISKSRSEGEGLNYEDFVKFLIADSVVSRIAKMTDPNVTMTFYTKGLEKFQVGIGDENYVATPDKKILQGFIADFMNEQLSKVVAKPKVQKTSSPKINKVADDDQNIKTHYAPPENYLITGVPNYVVLNGEFEMFDAHLESNLPLLLQGPKGTGKTLSLASWAEKRGMPIIQFDCSETTKRSDLIGRFIPKGDEIVFELGIVPVMIEVVNKLKIGVGVFEEINALTPAMQKVLNQVLDWRGHVFIPEIGKLFKVDKGCKILFSATMNPSNYGGVYELNEDLKSRFCIVKVQYPTSSQEKKLIDWTDIPTDMQTGIMNLAVETRNAVTTGSLDYAISPRDIDLFCRAYRAYNKQKGLDALKLATETTILGKYDEREHENFIKTRLDRIFNTTLLDEETKDD